MKRNEENALILAIKAHPMFARLAKVTTMLPPPRLYTNRYVHTFDVVKVANIIRNKIINEYNLEKPINLKVSCILHDLGHCCFAHETEEVVNEFLGKKLSLPVSKISFSHAINGALVLAIASDPKRFPSDFSDFKLFDNPNYDEDARIIVDSIIKHSFNPTFLDGIYFKFVDSQFNYFTGKSLKIADKDNSKPVYNTGYYVRVADDVATKNSDILDLFEHYHGRKISRKNTSYYLLCKKYVDELSKKALVIKNGLLTIEDLLKDNILYKSEKNLLKQTYSFEYKCSITEEIQRAVANALDVISDKPWLLKKCGFDQCYSYIKQVFEAYSSKTTTIKELNETNLNRVKTGYYTNPYDELNPYVKIYRQYLCCVAYELTNFTDKDFIDFVTILSRKDSDMKPICDEIKQIF